VKRRVHALLGEQPPNDLGLRVDGSGELGLRDASRHSHVIERPHQLIHRVDLLPSSPIGFGEARLLHLLADPFVEARLRLRHPK